jgi:hypothetical protein
MAVNAAGNDDRKITMLSCSIFNRRQQIFQSVLGQLPLVYLKTYMPSGKGAFKHNRIRPVAEALPFFTNNFQGAGR